MTRTISVDLKNHLAAETTTIAWCWSITRTDGEVFCYTTHDVDITYGGNIYKSNVSFVPSAIATKGDFSVSNLECLVFLDDAEVSKADIIAGLFNSASLDIFLVNYEDTTMGRLVLAQGWILGESRMEEHTVYFEIRSKTQKLDQTFVRIYAPECNADLGDTRCGKTLASWTHNGTVVATYNNRHFFVGSNSESTDVFAGGKLTWTSGLNSGFAMEVKAYTPASTKFELFQPMPYAISASDTYSVYEGCDKKFDTCRTKFGNHLNFRGFPHVPGKDKMLQYKFR